MNRKELTKLIKEVEKQMRQAAADLNFEQAAELRDKMIELKKVWRIWTTTDLQTYLFILCGIFSENFSCVLFWGMLE